MKNNGKIFIVLFLLGAFIAGACGKDKKTVSIGSKSFTEQFIIGNIMTIVLEKNGYSVIEKFGVGTMIARMGLLTDQIDLYAEYTGTAWTLFYDRKEKINDPNILYRKVKNLEYEKHRLHWLEPSPINNTFALAVTEKSIKKFGKSLSALAAYMKKNPGSVIFGMGHEFYQRPDGFKKMAATYGMEIASSQVKTMDIGLTFESMQRNQIDIAMVFATDGKIKKYNLHLLEDDKRFFPVYTLCVVMNDKAVKRHPEIPSLLNPIMQKLDNQTMQDLNYQVDVTGKPSKLVAEEYLKKAGIIKD